MNLASRIHFSAAVCAVLALSRISAGGIETDAGVRFATGYDTNPLRISGDGPGGAFAELGFDVSLEVPLAGRSQLFSSADGRQRFHGGNTSRADQAAGELTLGVALSPRKLGPGRLSLRFGGTLEGSRETFTDRFTGEVYRVSDPADPEESSAVPDRFDEDGRGVFVDARYSSGERWLYKLRGSLRRVDYRNDYPEVAGLDSLDHRVLAVEPELLYRAHPKLIVGLDTRFEDLDYDERAALDGEGHEVSGSQRSFRVAEYRLTARLTPSDAWKLRTGWLGGAREDRYAGWYDYDVRGQWLSVERSLGRRARLSAGGSHRHLSYHNATVDGSIDDARRGGEIARWSARWEREMRSSLRWYAEGGVQRVQDMDPEFAHDRDWIVTGIELRH